MPRIPYPAPDELDEEARRCLQGLPPINVLRMLSHSGPLLQGFFAFGNRILYSTDLEPELREMVIVRVAHLCKSAYELVQHERFIAELGVPADKIAALGVGASDPIFNDRERAVLAFVDDTVLNVRASDETLAAVSRHMSPRQIVELILVAGNYRMLASMLETCGVEIEDGGDAHSTSQTDWQQRSQTKKQS